MKTQASFIAASVVLAACGGAPEVVDPYADLAEDSILVKFETNPDLTEGECNPNVLYAMRTEEEAILLNVNFEVNRADITGSGLAIFDREQTGVATNTGELNMFDPYPMPCSDLTLRVMDLTCRTEDESDAQACPNPVYEGTDMFASFEGLPTY